MPKNNKKARTNRKLVALFFSSQWLIENSFAREALAQYLREEARLASGVAYSELGISTRRHAQASVLLNEKGETQEFTVDNLRAIGAGHIAHIKLAGVMFAEDQLSTRGISSVANDIRLAASTPGIEAIVLEVNSGGGQAKAGPMIASAIKDVSQPVIAYVHTAGSAAYWAIAGVDEIVLSSKQAEVGSIGAYVTIDKWEAAIEKEYIDDIYSDLSIDKNKEWRAYQEGNKGPLIEHLNQLVKIFHNDIKGNRSLNADLQDFYPFRWYVLCPGRYQAGGLLTVSALSILLLTGQGCGKRKRGKLKQAQT